MSYQQGFTHAVVIIGLVIALAGSLGFIFWQNYIRDEPRNSVAESSKSEAIDETVTDDTKDVEAISESSKQELVLVLNSRKVTVDFSDAQYDDIVAVFDDSKGYYDVYSKHLKYRLDAHSSKSAPSMKGCNSTVVIDTYTPEDDIGGHLNKVGEANGQFVHTGFLGPCDPSTDAALSNEMFTFRDYIVDKMKAVLQ